MNIYENGEFLKKANPGEIVKGGDAIYKDETGTVIIPEGFAIVKNPDTINNGLVISDKANDYMNNTAQGNQFVWVPVENDDEFKLYTGYYMGSLQGLTDYCEPAQSENQYLTEQTEYEKMKDSVTRHNGFFVGRYEAGTTGETGGSGIRGEVVSRKGANVYYNIKWGNSMTDETGGAVEVAKTMYSKEKGDSVTSTLIYGAQWDAIMAWIEPKYKNENEEDNLYEEGSFVANSTEKGKYDNQIPTTTGSNENYVIKNIYDLAGNVREWTMESYSNNCRVTRGRSLQ